MKNIFVFGTHAGALLAPVGAAEFSSFMLYRLVTRKAFDQLWIEGSGARIKHPYEAAEQSKMEVQPQSSPTEPGKDSLACS